RPLAPSDDVEILPDERQERRLGELRIVHVEDLRRGDAVAVRAEIEPRDALRRQAVLRDVETTPGGDEAVDPEERHVGRTGDLVALPVALESVETVPPVGDADAAARPQDDALRRAEDARRHERLDRTAGRAEAV